MTQQTPHSFVVIVPAAGVGKRMQASCPKQYLDIEGVTVLEHTVNRLLSHPKISTVIIALGENDDYFCDTSLASHPDVLTVIGGRERVDSVVNGLNAVDERKFPWALVHDGARPCVSHKDISNLIEQCLEQNYGGLLATPVVDTIKQNYKNNENQVLTTVDREHLWHALTPQLYKTDELRIAIEQAQLQGMVITDESSAIEYVGLPSLLVSSCRENIKITRPEDLLLAAFYLQQQRMTKEDTLCE